MAAKTKPFELFGSYILLKKLESDALGDLHRALRIVNGAAGPVVALRRFTAGNRDALISAAETAQLVVSSLTGPSFVKDQQVDVISGIPAIAHEYSSGRSLRYLVDRARGGSAGATPNPLPLDQAIIIAERVALSLATTSELRLSGERLLHGGLIPQFVWITDDGEIRVAGQQMGVGLAASLRDEKIAHDIGRYFAPETHHSGQASKSTEIYSLGAILYLLVTGQEPPDATRTSAFAHAVRASKTMAGAPMPDDIRAIIEKSLNIDPASRYASAGDMRAALSALAASGKYSATSFNLAFYLSNLLKKEFEAEAAEQEREAAIEVAAYLQPAPAAQAPVAAAPVFAAAAVEAAERKSKVPVAIAATLVLAAAGAGAWFFLGSKQPQASSTKVAAASALPPPVTAPAAKSIVLPEPIVASPAAESATAGAPPAITDSAAAEAAKKKLFDDAVKKRLQEEMLKLQAEYTRQLRREQARTAPVLSTAAPQAASVAEERAVQGEDRRESSRAEEPAALPASPPVAQTATTVVPTASIAPQPQAVSQTTAPAPAAIAIREGDVVDMADLDRVPAAVREPRPVYPAIAARQRMEATIMASVFISETGAVLDVKILRGDPRFGFNDAAIRAFRGARYTPAMKDGKRVKTWVAQMIQFKP